MASPKFCRQTSNRSLDRAASRPEVSGEAEVHLQALASASLLSFVRVVTLFISIVGDDRMWRLWTCSCRVKASSLTWAKADDTYGGRHRFGTPGRTEPAIGRDWGGERD